MINLEGGLSQHFSFAFFFGKKRLFIEEKVN
jgi:hypothetical protein